MEGRLLKVTHSRWAALIPDLTTSRPLRNTGSLAGLWSSLASQVPLACHLVVWGLWGSGLGSLSWLGGPWKPRGGALRGVTTLFGDLTQFIKGGPWGTGKGAGGEAKPG